MKLPDTEAARRVFGELAASVSNALGAGVAHRRRLGDIDTRIVVSGVRGKSTATRWLHDVFERRGYDTYAKITGNHPVSVYNGTERAVKRDEQVRLYENERELRGVENVDVAIFENQGIRQYTTRLVNQSFVDPHVVFLTNVREDHLDTMGRDRQQIARSLARAVPRGTPVVSGESDERLQSYLTAELRRRDAPVTHVDPPEADADIPGVELVYGLSDILDVLDEPPIPASELDRKLGTMVPEWRVLPNGYVHDAASVNDVQSTELVRRALVGPDGPPTVPLVFLRADRRGRTASFVRYLGRLLDNGAAECVYVVGGGRQAFAANVDGDIRQYDHTSTAPADVLDDALSARGRVVVMGNTVDDFMRELADVIRSRTVGTERPLGIRVPEHVDTV
ncbi:Mur ligase [Halapricum sp. CBA1109]|uniref:Mur ligase family protein n=1 Tax=Halapricum sp. CBA1109 TaxID=2668068 RepID=UPI0012F79C61|nr:Mur ligase family protein [Halapricum sp. CBA1109]MUV89020.1 Mur ligase [Halapricum sp. CBA1109]